MPKPIFNAPDLLHDLEALYKASLSAASFGTALKVKELIVRLAQGKNISSPVPDITAMTDEELETFVTKIKDQLVSARKTPTRKTYPARVKKLNQKSLEQASESSSKEDSTKNSMFTSLNPRIEED
ncbi:MAG: hypothetical protein LBH38_00155 [Holosporales bacterium]|jgi:hypothetical protein|nr:hypothetical protein [Holosporales bacterium]